MPDHKNPGTFKRPGSPVKGQQGSKKAAKSLSFTETASPTNMTDQCPSGVHKDGGAQGVEAMSIELNTPPRWFQEFEIRQDERFAKVYSDCKEMFDGLKLEFDNRFQAADERTTSLESKLKFAEQKLDGLENRSRRCNLVIFNLPEREEGRDCFKFVHDLITRSGVDINPLQIQRVHRTGFMKLGTAEQPSKPRPTHMGFSFYKEKLKEECRRSLAEYFKQHMVGNAKLFVSNDYSAKVQQMRRAKLADLRKLRAEGKQAFFVYPASIKIRDEQGNIRNP